MSGGIERNRLRWRCRRGILELDLLLGRFLDQAYDALPEQDKQTFGALLEESDQTLLGWLNGVERPTDEVIRKIITKIAQ